MAMDKLDDLVEMAEKADAVANLMDAVNPHDILAIAEAFRELERRAEAAWAEAKHQLGVNVVLSRHNQAIVAQRDKALSQLSELARQEPDYFLNRIESSDKWGPETDLRIYESQLGASKSQDDHGGGIIELFTRPAPAAAPMLQEDEDGNPQGFIAWYERHFALHPYKGSSHVADCDEAWRAGILNNIKAGKC